MPDASVDEKIIACAYIVDGNEVLYADGENVNALTAGITYNEVVGLLENGDIPAGLEEFRKFQPKKLSGGLLRRLNIACGIAHKPKLIFMDEPTVAVDPQSRNKILEGIMELNKNGATIIYTSHYMEEVEQICTRIAIMDQGKNLAIGTTDQLKNMIKTGETIQVEILNASEELISEVKELPHVYKVEYVDNHLKLHYTRRRSFETGRL